jgi:hypothetical protein
MALGHRPRTFTGATDGAWAWPRVTDRPALVFLIPFVFAAAFFVVFIAQLRHNLWVIGWSSDSASGFTIPATLVKTGTGGHTVMSTTGAYLPLWFGLLTARLPLHRELWEIAPTGLFLVTALAVGWSVARIADRRAGALAALLILAASPRALYIFMAPVAHNTVYPGTALLGAYLVWLAQVKARRRAVTWTVALLAGVALGTAIASDSLLIVTGVVPFALTAALAGVRRCRRSRTLAASALSTVAVAIPIAKLTSTLMGSLGFVTLPPSTAIASLSTLPRHAELMWEGLKALFNGYLREAAPGNGLRSGLGLTCEIIMTAALLTLLIVGVHTTVKFIWSGLRRGERAPAGGLAGFVHIIYWAGSAATTCVAFALSTRTEYVHEAYYATLIFSVAAVVVVVARARSTTRWLVSAGASVFFAASLVGLTSNYIATYVLPIARSYTTTDYVPPIAQYQSQITAFAEANRAELGFAGYWDASNLTWNSAERILVRPIQLCANPSGADVCPFFLARVPSWYAPSPRRTFLLVDSGEGFLSSLPQGLGRPIAAETFGRVQMYVYSYDIASRMGPAPN